jgi:electron transport complex protein RnfB
MTSAVIWTIVILAGLGLVLALLLYLFAQKFKVSEDSRIEEIEGVLPGANCGGCGYAGCHDFAASLLDAPDLSAHYCPVGGDAVMEQVAAILGYKPVKKVPKIAVIRCNGTCEARPKINIYDGAQSCVVKAGLYAGDTACSYGCLGCGDCVEACLFGALSMDPATGLPVVDEEKCTACGACVKACPKDLIELRDKGPRGMRMFVACRNIDKGPVAKKACSNACIACAICFKTCRHDAIIFENNLASIDYSKCKLCRECEAVCPTGAIHGINFPKPLDKAGIKERIAKRK